MKRGRATKGQSPKNLWHQTILSQTTAAQRGRENMFIGAAISSPPCLTRYRLVLRRSWSLLHRGLCINAGAGRVCGPQLRRMTTAISDRELLSIGPVGKVAGSICLALVQIPLLCRLQSWSQAEAGFHCRLYMVLTPTWSTLARLV